MVDLSIISKTSGRAPELRCLAKLHAEVASKSEDHLHWLCLTTVVQQGPKAELKKKHPNKQPETAHVELPLVLASATGIAVVFIINKGKSLLVLKGPPAKLAARSGLGDVGVPKLTRLRWRSVLLPPCFHASPSHDSLLVRS